MPENLAANSGLSERLREAAESRIGWRREGIVVVHRSLLLAAADALDKSVPGEDWLRAYNAFLAEKDKNDRAEGGIT